jgi:hypothetical protein
LLLSLVLVSAPVGPSWSQQGSEVVGQFIGTITQMIERQQQIEAMKNSPEYQDQQIQPGGLTRGQVIIVQQILVRKGYDVGEPDGIVGPKTRAVVGELQYKAGVPVTGYPTQQLLDALLQSQ